MEWSDSLFSQNQTPMLKTRVSEIYKDEEDIIHIRFPEKGMRIELRDSHEILETRTRLSPPGSQQLILTDLTTDPLPTRDARNYANSPEMNDTTTAMALIVNNGFSKILGNMFLGFSKGQYPVKLFVSHDEARAWLMQQERKRIQQSRNSD